MKPLIIGIAGGSASGKTSISRHIQEKFSDLTRVLVIRQDDYYKDQSHKPMSERIKTNYDHPSALSDVSECCYPCDVLILEGLFILEDESLRNLLDIKVFVDTDADIRFIRRLNRDVQERGRTMESVVNQYMSTVRPMHESFIEPSKRFADIIIPEGGANTVAIDLLNTKISSILTSEML